MLLNTSVWFGLHWILHPTITNLRISDWCVLPMQQPWVLQFHSQIFLLLSTALCSKLIIFQNLGQFYSTVLALTADISISALDISPFSAACLVGVLLLGKNTEITTHDAGRCREKGKPAQSQTLKCSLGLQAIKDGHISQHSLSSSSLTLVFLSVSPYNTLSTYPHTAYATDPTDVHSLLHFCIHYYLV